MNHPKRVKRTRLNAWLLTWEGTDGPAVDPNKKVIAVLDARRSESFVRDLVDLIYSRSCNSAYEMGYMANRRRERNKLFHDHTYPSNVLYGPLPCIFARRVLNLTITVDEDRCTEHLRWTEPPVFGNAPVGAGVVQIVPARAMEHSRSVTPLSRDRTEA